MSESPTKLLYVDDDPGLARLVQRGFERHGYAVELAADGESGIARLAQGGIDVVALDQFMPGLDGLETLERIRGLPTAPPVVFVTASQDSRIAVAALKAGATDYVIKDAQGEFIPLLTAAIDNALGKARMLRAKDAAEAEVRAARDRFEALATERAVLLREVNHRVGNSLQLIAAFLQLQATATKSDNVKAALTSAVSRVMAVAQVHKRLYTSEDVQSVAVDQYLAALVDDLGKSSDDGTALVTLAADQVFLDPDSAVAVGVIVNELVINALKYAYPNGSGPIRVALRADKGQQCVLSVEDDGIGHTSGGAPKSTGLGQRIVKAMATKLDAQLTQDRSHVGSRIVISFRPREAPAVRP
jgi:two-component sensor histidine kinase